MKPKNRNLLDIHIAVLLFGMAGLFGKLIFLPALIIVLGRVIFAAFFLSLFFIIFRRSIKLKQKKDYFALLILGVILSFHWWTFFQSIQISTVAVGLLTFSTFPIFVTFLEPFFLEFSAFLKEKDHSFRQLFQVLKRVKIKPSDLILAFITFFGVSMVIPRFRLADSITQGALWGMASGFSFAILSILNKKYVKRYSSLVIAFYQDTAAAIILIPFLFLLRYTIVIKEIVLLILLGVVFTAAAHSLFIKGLNKVRAQTASIIACLEPLYGIMAAIFLLNEIPNLRVLLGGIVILAASTYATIRS